MDASSGAEDDIQLAKIVEDMDMGAIDILGSYYDLPIQPIIGRLYYSEAEDVFLWHNGSEWFSKSQIPYTEIWTWGAAIGRPKLDEDPVTRSSPVSVINTQMLDALKWTDLAMVSNDGLLLSSTGVLYGFGNNFGTVNLGSIEWEGNDVSSPISISSFNDWKHISRNGGSSVCIREDGSLWTWGWGHSGSLGFYNESWSFNITKMRQPLGGFSDWVASYGGSGSSAFAKRENGSLWTWGANGLGQLGDGTTISRSSPVSVIGGISDWTNIGVDQLGLSIFGTRADGSLWTWGFNTHGQLGHNDIISKSSPVSVVGGIGNVVKASGGELHALFLTDTGDIWSMGNDFDGPLGQGLRITRSSPVSVVGGFTDWIDIAAGHRVSFGLRQNGTLWSWGKNDFGQLGQGNLISRSSPVSVLGGFTDWAMFPSKPAVSNRFAFFRIKNKE